MTSNSHWKRVFLGLVCVVGTTSIVRGDGGTPRFSGDVGEYHMTVFTEPTPLRAGPVDVSVLLQNRQTGDFVTDAKVNISVSRSDRPHDVTTKPATAAWATNKFFQASSFELPKPGTWTIRVTLPAQRQPEHCEFSVNVGPRLPRWIDFIVWIGLPVIPIALFAVRETGRHRASRTPSAPGVAQTSADRSDGEPHRAESN